MIANPPRSSRHLAGRGAPQGRAAVGALGRAAGGLLGGRRADAGRPRCGRAAASLLLVCLLASGLAACGSSGGNGSGSATQALVTPLATSLSSASGSWALLPAGASSGEEHFWELLHRGAGSSHWSLATPPGVQDNGGLAIAAAGYTLLAGFLPSYNLHFSPLALTTNGGTSWTPTPVPLPSGLTGVPDSLALDSGGTTYALLANGGGEIVVGNTRGDEWRSITNARALVTTPSAPSARTSTTPRTPSTTPRTPVTPRTPSTTPRTPVTPRTPSTTPRTPVTPRTTTAPSTPTSTPIARGCGLTSIDAIASLSPDGVLAGGTCTKAGQIGEYAYAQGGWRAAAPPTPAALRGIPGKVLWLTSSGATTLTLVDFPSPSQNTLLAAWSSDGGHRWSESPPLAMGSREDLIAAGPAPHDKTFLLLSTPHGNRLRIGAPTTAWRATPRPPEGTATVVVGGNGEIDALAAHVYNIVDWRLVGTPGAWHSVGTLRISVSTSSH
jgi:hypothetical protein